MNWRKKKSISRMQYCPKCNKLVTAMETRYEDGRKIMVEIACKCGRLLSRKEF